MNHTPTTPPFDCPEVAFMTDVRSLAREDRAVVRALGEELRRLREARDWTRADLVSVLPSGIGERTLISYELGARDVSFSRLLELARALETPAPQIVQAALENARLDLDNITVRVDVRRILVHPRWPLLLGWARTRAAEGMTVVELGPATVREMAAVVGCSHIELAHHLIGADE